MNIYEVEYLQKNERVLSLTLKAPNLKRVKLYAQFEKDKRELKRCKTIINQIN